MSVLDSWETAAGALALRAATGERRPALTRAQWTGLAVQAHAAGELDTLLSLLGEDVHVLVEDGRTLLGGAPGHAAIAAALGRAMLAHPSTLGTAFPAGGAPEPELAAGLVATPVWLAEHVGVVNDTAGSGLAALMAARGELDAPALTLLVSALTGRPHPALWTPVATHPALARRDLQRLLRTWRAHPSSRWAYPLLRRRGLSAATRVHMAPRYTEAWAWTELCPRVLAAIHAAWRSPLHRMPWTLLANPDTSEALGISLLTGTDEGETLSGDERATAASYITAQLEWRAQDGITVPGTWLDATLALAARFPDVPARLAALRSGTPGTPPAWAGLATDAG